MTLSFDLISDLHVDTWNTKFDWTGMPTSSIAVVAGDISRDQTETIEVLEHLNDCYNAVLYIDGNSEHRWNLIDLKNSYKSLYNEIEKLKNVIYLQDNVAVINGVAFVGTNAWWTYDFSDLESYEDTRQWFVNKYHLDSTIANTIEAVALQDVSYLANSIKKLQTHQDIKKIVVVTHTVPFAELIEHDPTLSGT